MEATGTGMHGGVKTASHCACKCPPSFALLTTWLATPVLYMLALKRQDHIELQTRLRGIMKTNRAVDEIDKMILDRQCQSRQKHIVQRDEVSHDVCPTVPAKIAVAKD